jgi:putative ABC transport system permease protein
MSLGARQLDVLRQFLFEAVILSLIGGMIGLLIAELLGFVITAVVFPTRIPFWAILVAIGVSVAVGVGAGLYPAWKAARLDPIEALRAD